MNEEEIFHEALARGSPEERAAYLEQARAGDPALPASVEALLRANVGASGFLDPPAPARVATAEEQPVNERPGAVVGPYKLLEQIGMGTVWMAQQTEPVKRLVAVKLLKAGMHSRKVIARFEAERQALAMTDRVNIARAFDGGTTRGEPGGVRPGAPVSPWSLVHGAGNWHCNFSAATMGKCPSKKIRSCAPDGRAPRVYSFRWRSWATRRVRGGTWSATAITCGCWHGCT
jgi:hypothetical protein